MATEDEKLFALRVAAKAKSNDVPLLIVSQAMRARIDGKTGSKEMFAVLTGVGQGLCSALASLHALLDSYSDSNASDKAAAVEVLAMIKSEYEVVLADRIKTVPRQDKPKVTP